jgi:hypothetical protein
VLVEILAQLRRPVCVDVAYGSEASDASGCIDKEDIS